MGTARESRALAAIHGYFDARSPIAREHPKSNAVNSSIFAVKSEIRPARKLTHGRDCGFLVSTNKIVGEGRLG
ncbi:MAG: hypothetical protein ABL909_08240 [Sphingopyxis sp.]